jgi:hypothetical protein
MGASQVLCQRLVEDPQRMGKMDPLLHPDLAPAPHSPGSAGKIAEAVHRDCRGLCKGRDMKCPREVRQMVFYSVNLPPERGIGKRPGQMRLDTRPLPFVAQPLQHTSPRSGRFASVNAIFLPRLALES